MRREATGWDRVGVRPTEAGTKALAAGYQGPSGVLSHQGPSGALRYQGPSSVLRYHPSSVLRYHPSGVLRYTLTVIKPKLYQLYLWWM